MKKNNIIVFMYIFKTNGPIPIRDSKILNSFPKLFPQGFYSASVNPSMNPLSHLHFHLRDSSEIPFYLLTISALAPAAHLPSMCFCNSIQRFAIISCTLKHRYGLSPEKSKSSCLLTNIIAL